MIGCWETLFSPEGVSVFSEVIIPTLKKKHASAIIFKFCGISNFGDRKIFKDLYLIFENMTWYDFILHQRPIIESRAINVTEMYRCLC